MFRPLLILSLLVFFSPSAQAADHFSAVESAAEKGDATAQAELASIYFKGHDGFPDFSAAAKWYRKSADQGYAPAQYNLSSLYFNGYGVEQDYKEAYFWLLIFYGRLKSPPPDLGDTLAEIKINLSPEQLKALEKRVASWKPTPVQSSNCTSNNLGLDLCGGSHLIYRPPPPATTLPPTGK